MSLPDDFNPWEHLQSVIILAQNRRVRQEFNDVGEDDWTPDVTTSRGSLRVACTLLDDDSAIMTLLRLWLFDVYLRGASNLWPALYTMPVELYQESVEFAPQVIMYFTEDRDEVEEGFAPIDARISFRLTHESYKTMTPSDALSLAERIHSLFGTGGGYRWRKGRTCMVYKDKANGYQLSVNAYSESAGIEVIERVLEIQSHSLDMTKLTKSEKAEPPSIIPAAQLIYGKERRPPRIRPVGWVRFRYADLHIWGMPNGITLVDTTGRRSHPLVNA